MMAENSKSSDLYDDYFKQGRISFVTFHPSYGYEEFIEGLTVQLDDQDNNIKYVLKPGIFKKLCTKALISALGDKAKLDPMPTNWKQAYERYREHKKIDWDQADKFVLIIDEINRGDISKIFGELVTLLESDKRLGAGDNELCAILPLSNDTFSVPRNVYIIATMNTADRSIALLDIALRRRFGFFQMDPQLDLVLNESENSNLLDMDELTRNLLTKSVDALKELNKAILDEGTLGEDKAIGHSFLFNIKEEGDIRFVWKHEIIPLLNEYCYGNKEKEKRLLFGNKNSVDPDNIDAFLNAVINARAE